MDGKSCGADCPAYIFFNLINVNHEKEKLIFWINDGRDDVLGYSTFDCLIYPIHSGPIE